MLQHVSENLQNAHTTHGPQNSLIADILRKLLVIYEDEGSPILTLEKV
jgi:hypothetical protein